MLDNFGIACLLQTNAFSMAQDLDFSVVVVADWLLNAFDAREICVKHCSFVQESTQKDMKWTKKAL